MSKAQKRISKAGIFSLLLLICSLILLFSGRLAQSLFASARATPASLARHALTPTASLDPQASATDAPAFLIPRQPGAAPLQAAGGQYIIYALNSSLYLVSSSGDFSQVMATPGFINNYAVPPILTPGGQLLYSGRGIWLTDVFGGTPVQLATLDAGQEITSMALSGDGTMLAWSTEPVNGKGSINIYSGPLGDPALVYTQSALDCPCFRIFSFTRAAPAQADTTLLLTDDRGSHESVQYGLWSLNFSLVPALAQPILDENPEQGPLATTPSGSALLYSTSEGAVPDPTDRSIPDFVASLSYANSLSIGAFGGYPPALGASQVILPPQQDLSNSAQFHWVTTPAFSPDARTLAYVEFSNDTQDPYDRHSALFTVSITGTGAHLTVGKPQLLATSTDQLVELGPWLDSHTLTIYADGVLYALDVQNGAYASFAQPNNYARIIAVVE